MDKNDKKLFEKNRERFVTNANTKLTNAAVAIRRLAQLGNRKSYHASSQEYKLIIKELRKEVDLVEEEFNKSDYFTNPFK